MTGEEREKTGMWEAENATIFYKKLNFVEPYVHPSLPIMAKFGKRLNL